MQDSQLVPDSFNVVFDPSSRALHYNLKIDSQISGNIVAYIEVYAYGFKIITKTEDACELGWKQFCPLTPGLISVNSIQYVSKEYTDMIPGIAYQVPDIDAFMKLKIVKANDTSNAEVACIVAFFSNGKSVAQTGVKWATAIIAGIGLITSALLAAFGSSVAASHISANTMSLFLYFQSVVLVSMQHVDYLPPIASSWAENLAWSMGLIQTSFMQKIFRWYVQSTGGTPDLYLTSTTESVVVQKKRKRDLLYLAARNIVKRSSVNVLYGNKDVRIFRGIKRMGYNMSIEDTSIVATGLTFFLFCGYALAIFIICLKISVELFCKWGLINQNKFLKFRQSWKIVLKGALLKYTYIAFTQVTVLCIWEYFQRDSAAVIVMACFFILMVFSLMIWTFLKIYSFGTQSQNQYNNPAAILYGNETVVNKYSWFYSMFRAEFYWWGGVLLSFFFVKAVVIACGQGSGKAQSLIIFVIDLLYFVAVIKYKPYLDRVTNIINILMQTVNLANSFFFLFFSNLFGQAAPVGSIMAWLFFIINAAFSFILLMIILFYTGMVLWSKNPDLRFKPVRDDRMAFTKTNGALEGNVADELFALGQTANHHGDNWEEEIQDQKELFENNEKEENYRNSLINSRPNINKSFTSFRFGAAGDSSPTTTLEEDEDKVYQHENTSSTGLKSKFKSLTEKVKRNNTVLSKHSTKSVLTIGPNDQMTDADEPKVSGLLKSSESINDLKQHQKTQSDVSVENLQKKEKQETYTFI
ncbi:hypothetical protein QEN19_000339 [Hanseniaspora menglaensis]